MENTSDYFMPRPLLFCMKSEKSVCYSVPDNRLLKVEKLNQYCEEHLVTFTDFLEVFW